MTDFNNFLENEISLLSNLSQDLDDIDLNTIKDEFKLELQPNLTQKDLVNIVVKVLTQNIAFEPNYSYLAARYKIAKMQTEIDTFANMMHKAAEHNMLDPEVIAKFDLTELENYLDFSRDKLLDYQSVYYFELRYALRDSQTQTLYELPQYFFMRIAMGLSWQEEDPNKWAKIFYDEISQLKYICGGSTMRLSATKHPQLANCFLSQVEDNIEDIYRQDLNLAQIAKFGGGSGIAATKLRAKGGYIESVKSYSCGAVEWAQHWDHTLGKVQRGHKRKTAATIYMEPWHLDFSDFIRSRQSHVAEDIRFQNFHTVCWINDEFMKRVENNQDWYLLDPKDFPNLPDEYGNQFEQSYQEIEKQIQNMEQKNEESNQVLAEIEELIFG